MENHLHQLLLRSLDFKLSDEEATRLEQALKRDPALRKERAELLATRQLFSNWSVAKDPDFSAKVMQQLENFAIKSTESFSRSIIRLFPRVAAACVIFILAFLLNIYFVEGSLSPEVMLGIDNLYPGETELTNLDLDF
ncbi:MAG: anti-sigma factor [Saprospiraceae bacterium]